VHITTDILRKRLAENIKSARRVKKYSQEKLAAAAGISLQMINDIEGKRRWPSDKTLAKLADALEIDADAFFQPVTGESVASPAVQKEQSNLRLL
jgi:transcriptional regulator with XRE-family HTH domain